MSIDNNIRTRLNILYLLEAIAVFIRIMQKF